MPGAPMVLRQGHALVTRICGLFNQLLLAVKMSYFNSGRLTCRSAAFKKCRRVVVPKVGLLLAVRHKKKTP